MKLLIYSHFFAPSVGGVETLVSSLAKGLAALRATNGDAEFDVTIVTETPAQGFDDAGLGFRVIRQPGFSGLWRLIQESDVVHAAGPALAPLVLSLLARKPVVLEHHGFQTICPNGQLLIEPPGTPCPGHFMAGQHQKCLRCNSEQGWAASWKLWLLTFVRRFLSRRVTANIVPTAWLGGLLKLPRIVAIPHGIAANTEVCLVSAMPLRAPVITLQGRLVTTKGVGVLFEAARILSEQKRVFELQVIGDGPERAALESMSRQAPLEGRVRFRGRLVGGELEAALAGSSVVVVPSLGGEVFGLVVAENMLRGLPVITSDLGAFVEVAGDAALTFRTGDAEELARQLARLLDEPTVVADLAQRGRERALVFCDLRRMVEAHAKTYREATG
jgi:glycogen synthase